MPRRSSRSTTARPVPGNRVSLKHVTKSATRTRRSVVQRAHGYARHRETLEGRKPYVQAGTRPGREFALLELDIRRHPDPCAVRAARRGEDEGPLGVADRP